MLLYVEACGLGGVAPKRRAEEAVKVCTFTWTPAQGVHGEEGSVAAENTKDPTQILQNFKEFYTPKTNLTYKRYIFNRYTQGETDTFHTFLMQITTLILTCDCGDLKDDLLRDKIVVGINSNKVRSTVLRDNNLSILCGTGSSQSKQRQQVECGCTGST